MPKVQPTSNALPCRMASLSPAGWGTSRAGGTPCLLLPARSRPAGLGGIVSQQRLRLRLADEVSNPWQRPWSPRAQECSRHGFLGLPGWGDSCL